MKDKYKARITFYAAACMEFPDYSDIHCGIYVGGRISDTQVNLIKAYREHPLIKQAVRDMEHYIPEIEKTRKNIAMER